MGVLGVKECVFEGGVREYMLHVSDGVREFMLIARGYSTCSNRGGRLVAVRSSGRVIPVVMLMPSLSGDNLLLAKSNKVCYELVRWSIKRLFLGGEFFIRDALRGLRGVLREIY